jgi:hypothetical protein
MHVSERRACAALGQHRSTQRKVPRVERIWRREGLKVPHKQPKRGRYAMNC